MLGWFKKMSEAPTAGEPVRPPEGFCAAIQDHVMRTVSLMLAEPGVDENDFIPRLVAAGCSPLQALFLVLLVPLAFGRAALAGRPRMPATMPEAVGIPAKDRVYYVRLTAIPEYAAAAGAAASGAIPPGQVAAVGSRGSEWHAIKPLVDQGHDLTRSQVSAPFLVGVADTPGFADWFAGVGARDREVVEQQPQP